MDQNNDGQESAAKEVMDFVTCEYTRDGVHCRSANLQSGVFECVLPQMFPQFGSLMQDLCDSNVYDVEFHCDAQEARIVVYVGEGKLAPTLKNRSMATYRWARAAMAGVALVLSSGLVFTSSRVYNATEF